MKKKIFWCALAVVIALVLTAAGGSDRRAASDGTIRVGVALQGRTPFVLSLEEHLQQNVARWRDQGVNIQLNVQDGQNDAARQITQIENFITQRVDVILFNSISFDGAAPAVRAAHEAGIPLITLIGEVSNQNLAVSFVGSRHYDSGVMVMENAIRMNGNSFRAVVLQGVMGIDAQIQRMRGFNDVLARYPNITIVENQSANWERPEAMRIMENWIQGGRQFDVVISQNDNMALGAVEALRAAGLGHIPVYGVDGDSDAILAIRDGRMAGTALMSAAGMARYAIDYSVALAQGRRHEVQREPSIPFEWIDSTNVQQFLR